MKRKKKRPERWEDVKLAAAATVHRFIKDTGWKIDPEEAMSEAGLVFTKCRLTLDKVRASLTTWVCLRVYKRLLMIRRQAIRTARLLPVKTESEMGPDSLEEVPDRCPGEFDLFDFLRPLPGDAAVLVWLSFAPPERMAEQSREALRDYLTRVGWPKRRIDRAFATVRKHLKRRRR